MRHHVVHYGTGPMGLNPLCHVRSLKWYSVTSKWPKVTCRRCIRLHMGPLWYSRNYTPK